MIIPETREKNIQTTSVSSIVMQPTRHFVIDLLDIQFNRISRVGGSEGAATDAVGGRLGFSDDSGNFGKRNIRCRSSYTSSTAL